MSNNSGSLQENEFMDYLSRKLDNVVLLSKIVLNGELVTSKTLRSSGEIYEYIKEPCREDFCYVHLRLISNGEEVGEIKVFLFNGKAVACMGSIGNEKLYGNNALSALENLRSMGIEHVKMMAYSFDQSLIDKSLRKVITKTIVSPQPERTETAEKEIGEKEPAERKVGDINTYIATKLGLLDIPAVNVAITRGKNHLLIDIICDEESEIPPPKNIALVTIKYYIEAVGVGKAKEKIKVVVHHKKIYTETYDLSRDTDVWRLLGSIPEIIQKYNLYVEKLKYNIKNNRALEISLMLKRYGIYSTANIYEVTKEIYNKLKQEWKGDLKVKAKIGAWGLEAKYP